MDEHLTFKNHVDTVRLKLTKQMVYSPSSDIMLIQYY